METGFKIIVTAAALFFLCWLWTHQIDVKATLFGPFKKKADKPIEWIATRDPNVIYQNDKIVGNITGTINEINDNIFFNEICNTAGLNHSLPFEYKREKLKIVRIGSVIGMYSSVSNRGTEVKHNVLKDILCTKIRQL